MNSTAKYRLRATSLVAVILAALICVASVSMPACGADLISQALSDVRVLYLFDEPESVDWPTLYYLNEESGCRIDLVTVVASTGFRQVTSEIPGRGIYLHQYFLDTKNGSLVDSMLALQFGERRPDVVILGRNKFEEEPLRSVVKGIQDLPADPASAFNIQKIYRLFSSDNPSATVPGPVTINRREMFNRYRDRIQLEVPQLYHWFRVDQLEDVHLMRYETVLGTVALTGPDPDFLSGIESIRLLPVFDSIFVEGALKNSFVNRARNFLSFFNLSKNSVGTARVDHLVAGYKELITLEDQSRAEGLLSGINDFQPYLTRLVERARRAVFHEIGMNWDGEIILRDSPHGPKLKFRASLSVNGPKPIEMSFIRFHPYWDTSAVVLDDVSRKITSHQSFVREYPVEIDRNHLEAKMPESLTFSAEIVYGSMPLTVTSAVPIWEAPDLSISFEPGFFFVEPRARVEVDHVVSAMNWKAVISKPLYYHGEATLNLETPRGVFAGAYRQTWQLEKGRATETIRIPFSVSNLFELGIHSQSISLSVDGRVVAADTGKMRIASCQLGDTISIGLMPDTTGLLEDILRMAGASYWPLTDRTLQTGDLDAYNVIVIGAGALRDYPSFRQVKGRLENYLRYGGSLVIMGQPRNWPEGVLPVSFVPTQESVGSRQLLNRLNGAKVLSNPYNISEGNLLGWLGASHNLSGAVVSPAEKVYVTPSGATLLSVSRLGEGQIIFCGLPLVEMISDLNIEAIHLLANILNY